MQFTVASCSWFGSLANWHGKRTAQKRKARRSAEANAQRGVALIRATTIKRPDLLILLILGASTFGIYAQVIGHQFITLDDPTYIQENALPTTRCRCVRR